jgi:hypothetical protein
VVGYLTVLLLIAAFVAKPSPLGWVGFGVASMSGPTGEVVRMGYWLFGGSWIPVVVGV